MTMMRGSVVFNQLPVQIRLLESSLRVGLSVVGSPSWLAQSSCRHGWLQHILGCWVHREVVLLWTALSPWPWSSRIGDCHRILSCLHQSVDHLAIDHRRYSLACCVATSNVFYSMHARRKMEHAFSFDITLLVTSLRITEHAVVEHFMAVTLR